MSSGTYTLTEADVIAAYRLYFRTYMFSRDGLRRYGAFLLWLTAAGLGTGLFIVSHNGFSLARGASILAACVLALAGLLAFGYSRYRKQGRHYYWMGGLQGVAIDWSCTEQGRTAHTPHIQTSYAWTDYQNWAEDADTFLLYRTPVQFQIIPRRALSAQDVEAMRNYLIAADIKQIGPLR